MCNRVKKGIKESIDTLLEKHGVGEVKMFGHPIEDFELDGMTLTQIKDMKRILFKKINKYGREND